MVVNDNGKLIWARLLAAGFTEKAAAGIMGCLYHESGFEPTNVENSVEGVVGSDEVFTKKLDSAQDPYNEVWIPATIAIADAINNKKIDFGGNTINPSLAPGGGFGYGLAQWTYWTFHKELSELAKLTGLSHGSLQLLILYLIEYGKKRLFKPAEAWRYNNGLGQIPGWNLTVFNDADKKYAYELLQSSYKYANELTVENTCDIWLFAAEMSNNPGSSHRDARHITSNSIYSQLSGTTPVEIINDGQVDDFSNVITNIDIVKRALLLYDISNSDNIINLNDNKTSNIKTDFNLNDSNRWSAGFVSEVFSTIKIPENYNFTEALTIDDTDADYIFTNDTNTIKLFLAKKGKTFDYTDLAADVNETSPTMPPSTNDLYLKAGDLVFFGGDGGYSNILLDLANVPAKPNPNNAMWAWTDDYSEFHNNLLKIVQFFMKKGFTKPVAVGIAAAMHYENYCSPAYIPSLDRFGICGWPHWVESTVNAVKSFSKTNDEFDIDALLEFLYYEISNFPYTSDYNYGPLWLQLLLLNENKINGIVNGLSVFAGISNSDLQYRPGIIIKEQTTAYSDESGSYTKTGITDKEACFLAAYRFTKHRERPGEPSGPIDRGYLAYTYDWAAYENIYIPDELLPPEVGIVVAVNYEDGTFVSIIGDQCINNDDNKSETNRSKTRVRFYPVNPTDYSDALFKDEIKKYLKEEQDYTAFIEKLQKYSDVQKEIWISINSDDVVGFGSIRAVNAANGIIDPMLLGNIIISDLSGQQRGQKAEGRSNLDCIKIKINDDENSTYKDIIRVALVDENGDIKIISRRLSEIETDDGILNCYSGPIKSTQSFDFNMKDFSLLKASVLCYSPSVPLVSAYTNLNKILWQLGITLNKHIYFICDKNKQLNYKSICNSIDYDFDTLVSLHKAIIWKKIKVPTVVAGINADGNYKYSDIYYKHNNAIGLFGGTDEVYLINLQVPLNVSSGTYLKSFSNNGKTILYWIRIPSPAKTNLPMIVWFHGSDESGNVSATRQRGLLSMESELLDKLNNYIIVLPVCPSGQWGENKSLYTDLVKPMILDIISVYKSNKSSVIISGHSQGAIMCWNIVEWESDKNAYCGVSPVSFYCYKYGSSNSLTNVAMWKNMPVYSAASSSESLYNEMKSNVNWLLNIASNVNARDLVDVGGTHGETPYNTYTRNDWWEWANSCIKTNKVVILQSQQSKEKIAFRKSVLYNSLYWHEIIVKKDKSSTSNKLVLNLYIDGVTLKCSDDLYIDLYNTIDSEISIDVGHAFTYKLDDNQIICDYLPTSIFRKEFIFDCGNNSDGNYTASIDFKLNAVGDDLQTVLTT